MDSRDPGLAPSREDLAAAERIEQEQERAPQQRAEAVAVGEEAIRVLCSAGSGAREHTVLLELAHDGTVRGERRYAPPQGVGRAIAATRDGGFVVAGEARGEQRAYAPHLIRLDAHGDVVADHSLGPAALDGLTAVAVLDDGSIVAGGVRSGGGWLVEVHDDLRAMWEATLGDEVAGLAPVGGGFAAAAVLGRSTTALGTTEVAAYGPDRRERWRTGLAGEPAALAGAQRVVVAGHVDDETGTRLWAAALDAAGEIAWECRLDAGDGGRGRALAALPGGGVVLAGDARRGEHRGAFAARLDDDGTVAWARALDPPAGREEVLTGVAATDDDGAVLVGVTTAVASGGAAATVRRLDATGAPVWDRELVA
jgi:outer membrane protein assembly factor BamB